MKSTRVMRWLPFVVLVAALFGVGYRSGISNAQGNAKAAPPAPAAVAAPMAPQTTGTDNCGQYSFKDELEPGHPLNFVSIVGLPGVTQFALTDDSTTPAQSLAGMNGGLGVPYYGNNFTNLAISSNGYLVFGGTGTTFYGGCMNTVAVNNAFHGFGDDLNPSVGGTIHGGFFPAGSCPGNRPGACYIAQFTNVGFFGQPASTNATFQMVVRENGILEDQIQQVNVATGSIGLRNSNGSCILPYNPCTLAAPSNKAIYFFPPGVSLSAAVISTRLLDVATGQVADGPWCESGQARVEVTIRNTGTGPLADLPTNELVGTFTNLNVVNCTTTSGTCTTSGSSFTANHAIPAGGSVVLVVTVAESGGVQSRLVSTLTLNTLYPAVGGTVGIPGVQASTIVLACTNRANPNQQLGCQIHLPILNFEGQDDVCETWIEVQLIGCEAAKAVLVTWGEPGFCPPQAAGPLKVECTGFLRPGSTWNLLGAQIPTGSKGGMLFKFTARQLYEMGIDLGFDDVVADFMCETLFFGIVGDADDYRRFKKAYNEGLDFAGVPMTIAMGASTGYLAVDVLRKCPGDVTPGVKVTSKYNGISGSHLGFYDPIFSGYGYYVPLLYADKGGAAAGAGAFNTVMYIQNGGLECSSVEIWFKGQDDCLRAKICEIFTLAPGETYQFDASDCVGPDWQGSAWLRSSQPLGVAVDIIGRDVLMTYIGEPAEVNYTFNPNQYTYTQGNQVAYGPLTYSEYQGWDSGVQVQNLSGVVNAKVKVYFYDRSGDIITTLVDWICPRGSQTFFLPVVHDLPGNWIGWVRVESQEWITPGSPAVQPPNIVGVVTLIKYSDAARTDTREAIAYNLLPEHKIYDWQLGSAGGGLASGVGLLAVPSLLKDLDGTGVTTELSILNAVPKPGKTDFAIFIFDQNGLLDYVCQVLNDRQVEYLDLQTWGYINPGFKGSAIVSATFWEHDVFSPSGNFVRNLVGLGGVVVERSGTRLGEDTPGDEAAGDRAIPFAIEDLVSMRCLTPFTGLFQPICPGQPGTRPVTDCSVKRLIFGDVETQRPILLGDAVTYNSRISVKVPENCEIADLDVWLAMFHTQQMHDWNVALVHPDGTAVTLFAQICPGISPTGMYVRTILSDEETINIGNVNQGAKCPPDDFRRYNVQTPSATNTLAVFENKSPNGNWTLRIADTNPVNPALNDTGLLYYWELEFDLK